MDLTHIVDDKVELRPEFEKDVFDIFSMFDDDGSGGIDAREVEATCSAILGHPMQHADALRLITEADTNGDGSLDFEEFKQMLLSQMKPSSPGENLKETFKHFEAQSNPGYITIDSLREVAQDIGENPSEERLVELMSFISTQQSPPYLVDYEAFRICQGTAEVDLNHLREQSSDSPTDDHLNID